MQTEHDIHTAKFDSRADFVKIVGCSGESKKKVEADDMSPTATPHTPDLLNDTKEDTFTTKNDQRSVDEIAIEAIR